MILVFKCNRIFMPINVKCEIASMTWLIGHWIIVFCNFKGVNCTFWICTLMLHNFVLNIFKHLCKCYCTSSTLFVRFSYISHLFVPLTNHEWYSYFENNIICIFLFQFHSNVFFEFDYKVHIFYILFES